MTQDRSVNVFGKVKGVISTGDGANIIQNSSGNPYQPGIKELLTQLQEAIATAPERDLSERRRNKAQRLVQELAEAGKDPTNENNLDKADTAILNLNGIVVEMPRDSTTTQTINKIIPEIKKYFRL